MNQERSETDFCTLDTDYSHKHRERYLRFQRNIEKVIGKISNVKEYSQLIQTRDLNEKYIRSNVYPEDTIVNGDYDFSKQKLYATVHLGCFNLVAMYLGIHGVKFVVPVTNLVYKNNLTKYLNAYNVLGGTDSVLEFVNVEERQGLLRLMECVKKGYSLLFYIDGNSGVGGMERKDDKLCEIPFANATFNVRKGLGFLSHRFKLDVQPIFTNILSGTKSSITFLPTIKVSELPDELVEYEYELTSKIWKIFEEPILKWFEQWEPWLYADSYMIDEMPFCREIYSLDSGNINFRHNTDRFAPIIIDGAFSFYDKACNKLIKMNQRLFTLLTEMYESGITKTYKELTEEVHSLTLLQDVLHYQLLIKS